ncbi:PAS domain-containing protein [Streptomyces sp. NPDC005122]
MAGNRGRELGGDVGSALLEALFTQAPTGLLIVDADLRIQRVSTDSRVDRGITVDGLLGQPVTKALNAADPEGVEAMTRGVLTTGVPVLDRLVRGRPTAEPGPEHVYSVSAFRLQDSNGQVLGAVVYLTDVTERERERARATVREAARKKIGCSLDAITICRELVDVVVPEFADAVVVNVLDTVIRGDEPPLGPLFGDEPMLRAASKSATGRPPASSAGGISRFPYPTPYTQSLSDLEPRLVTLDENTLWLAADPERGRALREAGVHCMIVTPIVVRGAVLGMAGFYRFAQPEAFTADDLDLAGELVAFTAVCLDNARRFTHEHTIALTLQRHLLPQGNVSQAAAEVAHFHRPAEVSGGWFDAIPLSSARLALTVGEVAGHGPVLV